MFCFFSILVCLFLLYVLVGFLYSKYFIRNNSELYKRITSLNKSFQFERTQNLVIRSSYDNESFFNDISCEDYITYYLNDNKTDIYRDILFFDNQSSEYQEYLKQYNQLESYISSFIKEPLAIFSLFVKYNQIKLFNKSRHKALMPFQITVILFRTDLRGNIFEIKRKTFSINEIFLLLERIEDKNGTFYNDEGIWESICKVERGKVSNKLRFQIYQRDNYCCQICGATQYDAPLEIDHIIQISKGGKSTPDNLQTLCSNCNKIKGNKIYYK